MKIVLDTLGGDNPPEEIVRGGLLAANEYGVGITFAGDEAILSKLVPSGNPNFNIIHAPEVIEMEDSPAETVRRKKNSSLVLGIKEVRRGAADAFVSPANTGAVMAGSLFGLGRIKGIQRPGIALIMPTTEGKEVIVIDMGANTDCTAENLFQFAIMGRVYAHRVLGHETPHLALINIGSEAHKGNDLVKQAREYLKDVPGFVGNIEPNRLFAGEVDVAVCDGFVGNILLKAAEGGVRITTSILRDTLTKTSVLEKLGLLIARPALRRFRDEMNISKFGGAPLLGIKGVSIVAHGDSDAEAIKHAIRVAKNAVECDLVHRIEARIGEYDIS
jgi:glycerol-3-phosphate acyltransferase PlsX